MKYNIILVLLLVVFIKLQAQNIHYVNNNGTGAPQHFTNLQMAIDSADANDIIYLAPSPYSYGNITLSKKLTLIGAGYNIISNPSLNISTIPYNCTIGIITMNNSLVNGSSIKGVTVSRINCQNVSNLTIENNYIQSKIVFENTDSSIVRKCFFAQAFTGENSNFVDFNLTLYNNSDDNIINHNIFDSNTIFYNSSGSSNENCDNLFIGAGSSALVFNNIFRDYVIINDAFFFNNILLKIDQTNSIDASTSTVQFNVISANETSFANDNIINFGENNICIGWPTIGTYTFDSRFKLTPTSPAIGYGNDGGDCGPFDLDNSYKLSGIPNIPLIYDFDIPNQIPNNNQLNLIIKARKEN